MNTQRERISFNGLAVVACIVALIVVLLVGGVIVLCITAVALGRVGVSLFSRYTEATLKRDALRFSHIETVMKMGYLPEARNVQYRPMQIEAPSDIPVSVSGETASTVAPYSEDALNL